MIVARNRCYMTRTGHDHEQEWRVGLHPAFTPPELAPLTVRTPAGRRTERRKRSGHYGIMRTGAELHGCRNHVAGTA
jgi:hypothetical protein